MIFARFVPLLLLFSVSCTSPKATDLVAVIDEQTLQEGDIVFRLGRGTSSRIVNLADKEKSYSHIGIVVQKDSEWCVIHAVPGEEMETGGLETVKCDPISLFFSSDRTVDGVVMRFDSIDKIAKPIVEKAREFYQRKILFDHQYSLSDSSKMYCTELVYRIFKNVGIDLSEERRHSFPLINEKIIFPSDIFQNPLLREVSCITFISNTL